MWLYKNKEYNPTEEELAKWQGFVYEITCPNGKKYIGSKNIWYILKRKPLKGKKRKRLEKKQTDWRTYWSSSEIIKADIKENGEKGYSKEILIFCEGKGIMSYREAELQMKHAVLFDDNYLNEMIGLRINAKSVKGHKPLKL